MAGYYFNGRIDEVELFVGRALSDTEILAILRRRQRRQVQNLHPPTPGYDRLVAW